MVKKEKLLPVRIVINHDILRRLKLWGAILTRRDEVRIHFGKSLPLGYSARTAMLIGLHEIQYGTHENIKHVDTHNNEISLSVAIPSWFLNTLQDEAKKLKISRSELIRCALDLGLPS